MRPVQPLNVIILLQLLQSSILYLKKPIIEVLDTPPFEQPPFEQPSIAKAVSNFILYKFKHLSQDEEKIMQELARLFLHAIDRYCLEKPDVRERTPEEYKDYLNTYLR